MTPTLMNLQDSTLVLLSQTTECHAGDDSNNLKRSHYDGDVCAVLVKKVKLDDIATHNIHVLRGEDLKVTLGSILESPVG